MKIQPLNKFGTKLMVSSKSVNKIPYEYLSYSQNLRIYDGGIGVRKGKVSLYDGGIGTNQGGFSMNGNLYQVEGGKIWILEEGTRTEVATLGYDARCDFLVYQNTKSNFVSLGTETFTFTYEKTFSLVYFAKGGYFQLLNYEGSPVLQGSFVINNKTRPIPAIRIVKAGSFYVAPRKRPYFDDGLGIILENLGEVYAVVPNVGGSIEIEIGYYDTKQTCIIASPGRDVKVFDGNSVTNVAYPNTGILEYFAGRSFLANYNILNASRPITLTQPQYAYDWVGSGAYNVTYDSAIQGLIASLGGLYVFTEDIVEYISIDGSSAGLSIPLGKGANPINKFCIVSAGEKIFYITKELTINTVNYTPGINNAQVGELTAIPVVNIKELVKGLDENQPMAFAFNNDTEGTINFFLRTIGSGYNNICIVYDLINQTYNIDIGKDYNYVVKHKQKYFGYSDVNTSVYEDNVGILDGMAPIYSKGVTQNMNFGTHNQKMFQGFYMAGAITGRDKIDITVRIDEGEVFKDSIQGQSIIGGGLGGGEIGQEIGGNSTQNELYPFNIEADEGRVYLAGDRIQYEFESDTNEWILDTLGTRMSPTNFTPIQNKF